MHKLPLSPSSLFGGPLGALLPGSSIPFVCPSSILVLTHTHLPHAKRWGLGEKATVVQTPQTQLCILGCTRTKTPVWGAPEQRALGWCAPSVCLILPGGGQLSQDSAAPGQAEWPVACPPKSVSCCRKLGC